MILALFVLLLDLIFKLLMILNFGGGLIWIPLAHGSFDSDNRNKEESKINGRLYITDETERINIHNAQNKRKNDFGTYSYYDPVDEEIFLHHPKPQQSSGGYNDEKWLATDIMGALNKGTLIPQAAFGFVENTSTGGFLANGYQATSKAEMACYHEARKTADKRNSSSECSFNGNSGNQ